MHRFLYCQTCHGNWVDLLVLRDMFERLKPGYGLPALLTRDDNEPTLSCPTCTQPLAKRWMKRLALDQCDRHGVWFDGKELEKTLYTYAID